MINLAGDPCCEPVIAVELERAGIPEHWIETRRGEVPSRLRGKLGPVLFTRGWRYWIASGPVPLSFAEKLYGHPIAQCAGGDGVRQPPATQASWYTNEGAAVVPTTERDAMERPLAQLRESDSSAPHLQWSLVYNDDPASIASAYVDTYHIDSEEGLRLFADALRNDTLQETARPPWWDERPFASSER